MQTASKGSPKGDGPKKQKGGIFRKWMLIPIIILTAAVGVFAAYHTMATKPAVVAVPNQQGEDGKEPTNAQASGRKEDFFTFLLCGTDDDNGGTDTIIVASYDVKNQSMALMSVPRDTMVNVTTSNKRINATYNAGGVEYVQEKVGELIGFPIDFYVKVDLEGFVELVNAIGGVEFDVPYNMDYDDPTQNLSIHVSKGMQLLSGEDAIGVVRWRKNNNGTGYSSGDIGRIQTQQAFLAALGKQCLDIGNVTKISEFANIFAQYVDTNLTLSNIIWLAQSALGIDMDNVHFFTMPGNYYASYNGASYVLPYHDELLSAVNAYLNPYLDDVEAGDMDVMSLSSSGTPVSSTGASSTSQPNSGTNTGTTSATPQASASTATSRPSSTPRPSTQVSELPAASAAASPSPSRSPDATQSSAPSPSPAQSADPSPDTDPSADPAPSTSATMQPSPSAAPSPTPADTTPSPAQSAAPAPTPAEDDQ